MSTPIRPDRSRTVVGARPSALTRARLSEPVRVYAWLALVIVCTALTALGAVTGEWSQSLLGMASAALGLLPAAELARASVYSPKSAVGLALEAGRRAQGAAELSPLDVMLSAHR